MIPRLDWSERVINILHQVLYLSGKYLQLTTAPNITNRSLKSAKIMHTVHKC